MLCALTIRKLKPGTFDQFKDGFMPSDEDRPEGWVRFNMLRNINDENEVVSFGFFDGTMDDLNASQQDHGYDERRAGVDAFVESVVSNGVYEIVQEYTD